MMRYVSFATLVLAGAVILGCSREHQPENPSGDVVTLTTTVSFAPAVDTRALTEGGVKTLAADEQIAVVYENKSSEMVKEVVTLAAGDIKNEGKSAIISLTAVNPKNNGNLKIIYPADMSTSDGTVDYDQLYTGQDGTFTTLVSKYDVAVFSGSLDGEALPANVLLSNQLAICKFTIKDGSGSTMTGDVTKLTIKNGTDVYYINTSSLDYIWVALKPISSGDIDIYAAKGKYLYRKTVTISSETALAANTLTPISVTTPMVEGAISGLFRINAAGDLAYFSQGNLRATYWSTLWDNWTFATNQYDFIGNAPGNTMIDEVYYGSTVDLFGWSTDSNYNYYGINTKEEDSPYYDGNFYDWGKANIQNGGGRDKWRTPSHDEYFYILYTRTASTLNGVANARFSKIDMIYGEDNIRGGLAFFPDNYIHPADIPLPKSIFINEDRYKSKFSEQYTRYTFSEWEKMEAAGAIFLPSAGVRWGNTVNIYSDQHMAYYTSTLYATLYPWFMGADDTNGQESSSNVGLWYRFVRYMGYSVRLIGPAN